MFRKLMLIAMVVVVAGTFTAMPARAQSTVSFNLGYFVPRSLDSRGTGDVLFENLNYLSFNFDDFRNVTFGGDYLYPIGDFIEVGGGIGYYSRSVPSVYTDWVNSDGSEIVQELKLRIVPITATVRVLPLSKNLPVQPYVGVGVAILPWRYSETGDFVDFSTGDIFRNTYAASGTNVGPTVLGGVRLALARKFALGFEVRWQHGTGTLPPELLFSGNTIDLGGMSYNGTFNFKF
jgi:opacity protein-like surface antigen